MPEDEIDAVLEAGDPETVRRYFELHRERLQEQLDEQLRTLDALELLVISAAAILARGRVDATYSIVGPSTVHMRPVP